jgi:hypothetical protein
MNGMNGQSFSWSCLFDSSGKMLAALGVDPLGAGGKLELRNQTAPNADLTMFFHGKYPWVALDGPNSPSETAEDELQMNDSHF